MVYFLCSNMLKLMIGTDKVSARGKISKVHLELANAHDLRMSLHVCTSLDSENELNPSWSTCLAHPWLHFPECLWPDDTISGKRRYSNGLR